MTTKPIRECTRLGCASIPPGSSRQHCTACHQTFAGTRAGDRHRVGEFPDGRRCLTADEMLAVGLKLTDRGVWSQDDARPYPRRAAGEALEAPSGG